MEFLLGKGWLTVNTGSGEYASKPLMRDPCVIGTGRGADNCLTAFRKFSPLLREAGHRGITVLAAVVDRNLFRPLRRRLVSTQRMYYTVQEQRGVHPGGNVKALLTDWLSVVPCANHDAHDALKWAVTVLFDDPTSVLRSVFVGIESLPHVYDFLASQLLDWVAETLGVHESYTDPETVTTVWVTIGVESDVADQLADIDLEWRDDHLSVKVSVRDRAGLVGHIVSFCLFLFRFRKFTDSRWCTTGPASRTMCAAYTVGLGPYMTHIRSLPLCSDFKAHGFDRMTEIGRVFCAVTGLCSYVPDGVLMELLVDDRIGGRLSVLEAAVSTEQKYLANLPDYVITRLCSAMQLTTATPTGLRNHVMRVAAVAACYIGDHTLKPYRAGVWKLLAHDITIDIELLRDGPAPPDDASRKIWKLTREDFPDAQLAYAVALLGQIRGTSTGLAQGQAVAKKKKT